MNQRTSVLTQALVRFLLGGNVAFTYNDKVYETYPEIVGAALKLKGKKQKDFVKAYAASGKFALSNIGYVSGYYDAKTAKRILRIFSTAHPIFGTKR